MKFCDLVRFGFAVHEFDSGWKPYLSGYIVTWHNYARIVLLSVLRFACPWSPYWIPAHSALFIRSCESIFPICGFNSSWLKMVTWPIWDLSQFNLIPSDGTISERLVTKRSACAKYVVLGGTESCGRDKQLLNDFQIAQMGTEYLFYFPNFQTPPDYDHYSEKVISHDRQCAINDHTWDIITFFLRTEFEYCRGK